MPPRSAVRVAGSWRSWWGYVHAPLASALAALLLIDLTNADTQVAQTLFFDAVRLEWVGTHSWWTNGFLHAGGRWLVRLVIAAATLTWLSSYLGASRRWRRASGYFALASVLGVGTVGILKVLLHVPCPWDLQGFGGHLAHVPLFARHVHASQVSGCFPAAHAASGYALTSGYFALRERHRVAARGTLIAGLIVGFVFGVAQQSRGAHFVSHDVCSAILIWTVSASLYVFAYGGRVWPAWRDGPELPTMTSQQTTPLSIEPPLLQAAVSEPCLVCLPARARDR